MGDTPRTDAQTFDPYPWNSNGPGRSYQPQVMYPCDDGSWVDADFARELERDLAAERRDHAATANMLTTLRCELGDERALADRLAGDVKALRSILSDLGAVGTMGESALAAWKAARDEARH